MDSKKEDKHLDKDKHLEKDKHLDKDKHLEKDKHLDKDKHLEKHDNKTTCCDQCGKELYKKSNLCRHKRWRCGDTKNQ